MTSDFFPFHTVIEVRGYELDSFGHVNNAIYLNWIEHARWELFRGRGFERLLGGVQTVLRHTELDFRAETFFGDRLRISMWPRRVGTTSFTLGSMIRIESAPQPERPGKTVLVASSTLVCVAPGRGKVPVPQAVRAVFPARDPGPELTADQ